MYEHPKIKYALVITAMPKFSVTEGVEELIGVDITPEIFKVQDSVEFFESARIVEILDDSVAVTPVVREGLWLIDELVKKDERAKLALDFILEKLYLAARQKGVKASAEQFSNMVAHKKI